MSSIETAGTRGALLCAGGAVLLRRGTISCVYSGNLFSRRVIACAHTETRTARDRRRGYSPAAPTTVTVTAPGYSVPNVTGSQSSALRSIKSSTLTLTCLVERVIESSCSFPQTLWHGLVLGLSRSLEMSLYHAKPTADVRNRLKKRIVTVKRLVQVVRERYAVR